MTGSNTRTPNVEGTTSTVSSNTTNDLLLMLIGQLECLGVNGSNGGNLGVTGNGGSNDMSISKPPVAYHTSHSYVSSWPSNVYPNMYSGGLPMYPLGFSTTPAQQYSPHYYSAHEPLGFTTAPVQPRGPAQQAPHALQVGYQLTGQAQQTQQFGLSGSTVSSGQATTLPQAFTTGTLHAPTTSVWNFDTGASSHLNNSVTNLSEVFNSCMYPSVSVGDGHAIPVTNTGHSILPTSVRPLHLNNVLITPHIVKNLISVRQFVRDNNCTIEFDAFGFSVKYFMTRRVLLRCDSTGDLYPVTHPSPIPRAFLLSQHTWHQRLGNPGGDVLRRLVSNNVISCNNEKPPVLCHACQLGKHVRLPFVTNLPPTFWVEALNMATHLLNILPSTTITNEIPYTRLFGKQPDYSLLRTFGWLCYPHLYPNHKLEPRATPSILLGYASNHRGYRCLDLKTNMIIISRHVTFDETVFPYGSTQPALPPTYTFLDDIPDIIPPVIPTNPAVQLPPEPIPLIHNTEIQAHSPQQLLPDQVQTTETQAHSPPPSTSAVQQQTPTTTQSSATQHEPVDQPPIIIPDPPENPNPVLVHPMVTHFRVRTNRPTERLTLHVSSVSPLPKSYRDAFSDPNWQNAMRDEYHALIKNKTWTLVT
ncbi:ribonuclease H-like domain-containing protein [Tanacetum coccineum]